MLYLLSMNEGFLLKTVQNKRLFQGLILIFCLLLIVFVGFKPMNDFDIGWHLKTGEQILERGEIPKTDWFTHTFSDFDWISHEWLTDIGVYGLYSLGGPLLLSILALVIIIITFVWLLPKMADSKLSWEANLLISTLGILLVTFYIGVRPQILTMLGLVLVLLFWRYYHKNPGTKIIYWLPIFFLVWANLHAGFVVGLGVLIILLMFEWIKRKSLQTNGETWLAQESSTLKILALQKLVIILPISALATLINPYGYHLYAEVTRTLFDSYGTKEITEWLSPSAGDIGGMFFIMYLAFLLIIWFFRRGRMEFTNFILFILFLLAAFFSQRNIPLFVIVTLPFLYQVSEDFFQKMLLPVFRSWAVIISLLVLAGLSVGINVEFREAIISSHDETSIFENREFPVAAVDYLKDNPIEGNMLNEYNWGGYLIWAYPESKVFVDGRTPHWREGDKQLLHEYLILTLGEEDVIEMLSEYDVSYVILMPGRPILNYLNDRDDWEEVYRDDTAVIVKHI